MRRRIKRSSLFTMVAVVALLSLGIGYAAWQDTIVVNGTVNTGSLNLIWTNGSTSDSDGANAGGGTCSMSASGTAKTLNITVGNAYPDYECTVTVDVTNNGSVPAEFTGITSVDDGDPELSIDADCGTDPYIAPGDSVTCTADVVVQASAAEGSSYTAGANLNFVSTEALP